jgi:hypothetical protein
MTGKMTMYIQVMSEDQLDVSPIKRQEKTLLRIFTIALSTELRDSFNKRDAALSRPALDARNSPSREKTFYELISEKVNDPSILDETERIRCRRTKDFNFWGALFNDTSSSNMDYI